MPRLEYNDPVAETQFHENDVKQRPLAGNVPLPKERPSSADAEFNNSPEGRLAAEERAVKGGSRSWLGKAIYGR